MSDFDLIVIGSGPGGYVAAIRASQLGLKAAVVERESVGGICLNWGCIPTKALLRSAEVLHLAQHGADFGIEIGSISFDLPKIVARSRQVAGQLSGGVKHLLKKNKVTLIEGEASLKPAKSGPPIVSVSGKDNKTYTAKHVMIATGARAREIPPAGLVADGERVWTYRHALQADSVPKKLAVIGSGAIGIEFASFFSTLGSEVTVIEMQDRILPVEDADISKAAYDAFTKQGIKIHTNAQVESLKHNKDSVRLAIKTDKETTTDTFDRVILAIGIVANVEGLGLDALGVTMDRGHIKVDGFGRTNVPGLYAIGDVTGAPWLAHKASHEGVVCVEALSGKVSPPPHAFKTDNIPGCTYSHPQIASVGYTEAAAKEAGLKIKVGRFPFVGNGKAIAMGNQEGFVKTIFDAKTGELLGAHMIGEGVTELIQGYVIARQGELTEAELMETIFPHPTQSEAMHEGVLAAYGRALHI